MSQFLYYVPGCGVSISHERLAELGLDDRIDHPICRPCRGSTPDKGSGAVVVQSSDDAAPIMDMENQTWRPAPKGSSDSPPYWVGYASADPPGPKSLEREPLYNGAELDLQVGRWHVPVIRNFFEGNEDMPVFFEPMLPRVVDINDEGRAVSGPVIPKFTNLWDQSVSLHGRLYSEAIRESSGGLMMDELYEAAAKYIGVNYRVSLLELAILKSMSTDDCTKIIRTALDLDAYEEIVGNLARRSVQRDTDSRSGADRQETEPQTQPAIDPALEK